MSHTVLMMGPSLEEMEPAAEVLRQEGKTVLLETDFERSIEIVANRKVDLYMLDLRVVNSLGFDVHHRIQGTDPDCPIVTLMFGSPAYRPSFFPEEAAADVGPPGAPRLKKGAGT